MYSLEPSLGKDYPNTAWVWNGCVAEKYQRQGIGFALMEAVKQEARKRGWLGLYGDIDVGNTASLSLCRKAGFTFFDEGTGYPKSGVATFYLDLTEPE